MDQGSLSPLFSPRSVAVVGASRRPSSVGGAILRNLVRGGFQGPVYPVNRGAGFVQSMRAFPDLASLPETPDLVVVAVPASEVLAVVEAGIACGTRAFCVVTAGFGEIPGGKALEQELAALAKRSKVRLLGPNCLGLQNPDPNVRLDATFATTFGPPGNVAFASQSGALGLAVLDYAEQLGLGLSIFASLGNKADVTASDVLAYLENEPRTKVILLYSESLEAPDRLRELAARVGRQKPIAMVKSGRSKAGARAAGSHTGAITGPDAAVAALCRQSGILRADTLEDLFDMAMVLANQPLPKGRRVGIVTNAGGPGILATDALEAAGLSVPSLSPATVAALRPRLAAAASVANPVDVLAEGGAETFELALGQVVADPEIDAALAIFVPPITTQAPAIAAAIVRVAARSSKPILSCFMGTHGIPESLHSLAAGHVPSFRFPEGAARALSGVVAYAEWKAAPAQPPRAAPKTPVEAIPVLAGVRDRLGPEGGWLAADECEAFCKAWGLSLAPQRVVAPRLAAVEEAARELGYPVVLKAQRRDILHKSQAGAVALGIGGPDALKQAVERLNALAPDAYLVQRELKGGEEWLVGWVRDPVYGPLVTVGAGGTRTEIWKDIEQRLAPLSEADLDALVDRPRFARTLRTPTGALRGDRPALRAFVAQLAAASVAHPELVELELNPILVFGAGDGGAAVDARARLAPLPTTRQEAP